MEQTYDVFWDWTLNNGRAFHPITVHEGGEPENLVVSRFPLRRMGAPDIKSD